MKKILHFLLLLQGVSVSCAAQLNNNGATIRLTTGSFIVLQDMHLNNNGTFMQSAGSVKMTGASNNYILGSTPPQFFNLVIAKDETKQVLLGTPVNVLGEILFSSGMLHLNKKNIVLLGTAALKGEAENRRIIGPTGGYIESKVLLNALSNANPGNLGAWITAARNLGTTIIRRSHLPQKLGATIPNSITRHFEIIPAINTNLDADIRFSYFDAELNGLIEPNLVMYKKVNSAPWTNQGYSRRSTSGNYLLKNDVTDFYRLTLGIASPSLRGIENIDQNAQPATNSNQSISKNPHTLFIEHVFPTIGTMQNIYIRTGNMDIRNITVNVLDMNGKLILNRQAGYTSQWINLPPLLPAGTYQLVIRSGQLVHQQKFVKQQ